MAATYKRAARQEHEENKAPLVAGRVLRVPSTLGMGSSKSEIRNPKQI
jgi:hypothetical protein